MFGKIYSAMIVVADQDRALDFYVNTLGWEKGLDNQMGPDMRFLTVIPTGAETALVLAHTSWFQDSPPPAKIGLTLTTPNIDATYETLKSRGGVFKQPVEMMPWCQKATWMFDIDGNEYFVVEE